MIIDRVYKQAMKEFVHTSIEGVNLYDYWRKESDKQNLADHEDNLAKVHERTAEKIAIETAYTKGLVDGRNWIFTQMASAIDELSEEETKKEGDA